MTRLVVDRIASFLPAGSRGNTHGELHNRTPEELIMKCNSLSGVVKGILVFLVLLVLGLTIAVVILAVENNRLQSKEDPRTKCPSSSRPSKLQAKFTKSKDLFRDLSEDEIIRVRDHVLNNVLGVVPIEKAAENASFIFLIELQDPDKDEAIAYLDENGAKPTRTANVVIFRGDQTPPYIEELSVHLSTPMTHELNTLLGNIPFHTRPISYFGHEALEQIILDFTEKTYKILKESYDGYTYHNCTARCLTYSDTGPTTIHRSGERHSWFWLMRAVSGEYLQPVGLELLIQHKGSDITKWGIEKIYYNKMIFDSVEELLESYENGTVEKIFLRAPTEDELLYSSSKRRGEKLQPSVPLREPKQYEPDGKRYTASDNHVEYMGWSFDFRVRTTSGPQFFDIRFNGERIVYELSIQEEAAFYGGFSPMQSYSGYLDSMWGLGATFELVEGVDCPSHATYFDVIHFLSKSQPGRRRNAVCVFELNNGMPLRRHYENDFEGGYSYYGGAVATSLVVRTIVTPYNYDYIYDYIFYPNGVIETKVFTTGSLQATFWTTDEERYGMETHKNVAGSIHDHLLHFKVDFDVGGRLNNYETISAKVENISSRWFRGERHIQKYVVRDLKKTEQEAAYKFDFKQPCYLNFFNPNKTNAQGVRRGYRVHLNGIMNQLYPEHWNYTNAFHWSFYQMAVTKYKKTEERSSSIYNQNDFYEPVVDFRKFIEDNENIENADLVSWISVGLMHIPHAEDIPVTTTPGNVAGFFLRPFNYFDEDPSMSSRDSVLITPSDDGRSRVDRFGRPQSSTCLPQEETIQYDGRYD